MLLGPGLLGRPLIAGTILSQLLVKRHDVVLLEGRIRRHHAGAILGGATDVEAASLVQGLGHLLHGLGHLLLLPLGTLLGINVPLPSTGDGHDGRARSTEERAVGASLDGGVNKGNKAGDDGRARGLVKPVLGGEAEVIQVASLKAVDQQGSPSQVEDGV